MKVLLIFLTIAGCLNLSGSEVFASPAGLRHAEKISFGVVENRSVITRQIAFINQSPEAVESISIVSSCSCAKVIEVPERVESGKPAVFSVRYAPEKSGAATVDLLISARIHGRMTISKLSLSADVFEPVQDGHHGPEKNQAGGNQRHTYVDIRSSYAYRRAHVPGSLNMSIFTLATKQYLKDESLILVDDGFGEENIQYQLHRLASEGFKSVRYMSGGLPAWRMNKRPLEGVSTALPTAISISDIGKIEASLLWEYRILVNSEDIGKLVSSLKTGAQGLSPAKPVLIVAADRTLYSRLDADLGESKHRVSFLDGTISDWVEYRLAKGNIGGANVVVESPLTANGPMSLIGHGSKPCKACP